MTQSPPAPTISSAPILRATVLYSLVAFAVLALLGAGGGYLFAQWSGLWSAVSAVVLTALFLMLTALSMIIANRWFGQAMYPIIFFSVVLGGWLLKFVLLLVALFVIRAQSWFDPMIFFICVVVGVLLSLTLDLLVLRVMRMPAVSDAQLPEKNPEEDHGDFTVNPPEVDKASPGV